MRRSTRPRYVEVPPRLGGRPLAELLSAVFPELDDNAALGAVSHGRVRLGKRLAVAADLRVAAGEVLALAPPGARDGDLLADLRVLHADDQVIAIDKPSGLIAEDVPDVLAQHPDTRGVSSGARVVHRLDRGASGVLLLARDRATAAALTRQFRVHACERSYEALLRGNPPETRGAIDLPLRHRSGDNRTSVDHTRGKQALTHWELAEAGDGISRLRLHLETGRTHQIRVHLADSFGPILGDVRYGGAPEATERRLYLHATSLELSHPGDGRALFVESPLPEDFRLRFIGSRPGEI